MLSTKSFLPTTSRDQAEEAKHKNRSKKVSRRRIGRRFRQPQCDGLQCELAAGAGAKKQKKKQQDVLKEVKSLGQKGKVVELNELPDIVAFTKQNSKQKQIKIK